MITRFLLLLLLLIPVHTAYAQIDSISKAVKVVTAFHAEAEVLVKGLPGAPAGPSFHKESLESKEKTISEIKSLGWTVPPGEARFESVYSLVKRYMNEEIRSIKGLAKKGPAEEVEHTLTRLRYFRNEKLAEVDETLPYETYEKKKREPVPVIDTSPYEKGPGREKGIWDR
jgi:hypothetical protein